MERYLFAKSYLGHTLWMSLDSLGAGKNVYLMLSVISDQYIKD